MNSIPTNPQVPEIFQYNLDSYLQHHSIANTLAPTLEDKFDILTRDVTMEMPPHISKVDLEWIQKLRIFGLPADTSWTALRTAFHTIFQNAVQRRQSEIAASVTIFQPKSGCCLLL